MSTVLVLILVPSFFCILDQLFAIGARPEDASPQSVAREPAIVS